jgi:hypothetical protein
MEKGSREEFIGSKPHSKGEHFSRSLFVFFDSKLANIITILAISKMSREMFIKKIIIYTKTKLVLMIGSHTYLYTI